MYINKQPHGISVLTASVLLLAAGVSAQSQENTGEAPSRPERIEEIVVSGSRIASDLSSIPNSVTVLNSEDIREQQAFTTDPLQILANTIPGLGVASPGVISSFDQTLRGRAPAVFIDGIPTTAPLRDGGRAVNVISTNALSRVEVIRGATAIYGLGGTGGVINYVTKNPAVEGVEFTTDIRSGFSLTNGQDSLIGTFEQGVSGRGGDFSYVANGMIQQYGSLFDADGDRIPPNPGTQGGLADTYTYNVFGKLGYDLTDSQFVQFSANKYRLEQDTAFHAGDGVFGEVKTPSLDGPLADEKNQFSENLVVYGRYANSDVLGSSANLVAYYGENRNRYRIIPGGVFVDPELDLDLSGDQTQIFSEKLGIRLDVTTPLRFMKRSSVKWGIDYGEDQTYSTLANQGTLLVPHMDQTSWAPFMQLELDPNDWLRLRGGIRYEDISLDVQSFTTLFVLDLSGFRGGEFVEGGTLEYSKAVFNAGAIVDITEGMSIFGSFSQGFSVADIGRVLLFGGFGSVEQFEAEAQVIDSYELGIRGTYGPIAYAIAGFVNESDLGSTFNTATFELLRQKERIWGVEATIDAQINEFVTVGGSFSRTDGKTDTDDDGTLDAPLDTSRISPEKTTAYVEWEMRPEWQFRVQALYSAAQDRFPDSPPTFGRTKINSFLLLDASASIPVGPGRLTFGVHNLLNEDYFLPQALRNPMPTTYVKGPGASATVSYRMTY